MSAFGKRGGMSGGGSRPNFGVAKPMKGGPGSSAPAGGDQFPPIDELAPPPETGPESNGGLGAMDRLTARQNASGEAAS
ncbi:MAG: CpaF family protein, partial [Sphingomicrobium sp.]